MTKNISVLGSTGSVGAKALKIAKNLGVSIKGLAVFNNIVLLEEQIREFKPEKVAVFDEKSAEILKKKYCRFGRKSTMRNGWLV